MEMGLVQIYCGTGKGKTTAAIGQGIRAIGQGYKVIMVQFLKAAYTGEIDTLKKLEPDFKLFRFEKERGFFWNLGDDEKEELKKDIKNAMNFVNKVLDTKECEVLILDEVLGAVKNGLIKSEDICMLIDSKPDNIEIILTGRDVPEEIAKRANYISRIQAEKHPMNQGIVARKGIEY